MSAGFGNGIAVQPAGGSGRGGGQQAVRQGVFDDDARPVETGRSRPQEQAPSVQPVEILDKPNPVYTAEARALRIEGEVLLQVVFAASGELRVLRAVRGLGQGLDEAAAAAARRIRFKPQRINGKPVDSTAVLHVLFQLAY